MTLYVFAEPTQSGTGESWGNVRSDSENTGTLLRANTTYEPVYKVQHTEKEKWYFCDGISVPSTVLNIKQCFNSCYTLLVAGSKLDQKILNNFLIHAKPSSR